MRWACCDAFLYVFPNHYKALLISADTAHAMPIYISLFMFFPKWYEAWVVLTVFGFGVLGRCKWDSWRLLAIDCAESMIRLHPRLISADRLLYPWSFVNKANFSQVITRCFVYTYHGPHPTFLFVCQNAHRTRILVSFSNDVQFWHQQCYVPLTECMASFESVWLCFTQVTWALQYWCPEKLKRYFVLAF